MDPTVATIVVAAINTAGLIVVAWLQIRNGHNIAKIETATNSMKDALVRSTCEAAHAAGKVEGLAEGAAATALKAQGVAEAKGDT